MRPKRGSLSNAVCAGVLSLTAVGAINHRGVLRLPPSAATPARAVAVAPDGYWAVVAGGGFIGLLQNPRPGYAFIVNLKKNSVERKLPKSADGESGAVILRGGKSATIVTSSYDGTVLLSKVRRETKSLSVPLNAGAITALAVAADGKSFVAAGYRGNQAANSSALIVCNAHASILRRYRLGSQMVKSLCCSPNGRGIAVCDVGEGNVTLLNTRSGAWRVLRYHRPRVWKPHHFVEDYANAVAFTKTGLLVVGGLKGDLRNHPAGWIEIWDVRKLRRVGAANCSSPVTAVAVGGGMVAAIESGRSTGKGGSIALWSLATLKPVSSGPRPIQGVSAVAIFDHGTKVFYVTRAGVVGSFHIGEVH